MSGWTLAAAILGSGTALLIAFVAYPWQKRRDHEMDLRREQRSDYRRIILELHSLDRDIDRLKSMRDEEVLQTVSAFGEVLRKADAITLSAALSASPEVFKKVSEIQDSTYELYSEYGRGIAQMLHRHSGDGESADIRKHTTEVLNSDKQRRLNDMAELLSLMRSNDFGVAGKVRLERPDPVLSDEQVEKFS